MAHFLPSVALLLTAAMALVAPAASSDWDHNPACWPHAKYKKLGEFAVHWYNKQNDGNLHFVKVEDCHVLDRGSGHYTYHFFTIVGGGQKYRTEVLEHRPAAGYHPVFNLGYFILVAPPSPPIWKHNPNCHPHRKYRELGEFAVDMYNQQNHGNLQFVAVKDCWVLDRGTSHYTYRFITIVRGGKKYRTEVLEDLNAPGYPPVHNFGYFYPIMP